MTEEPRALPDRTTRSVTIILGVWLALATGVGLSGVFFGVPAAVIGATNASLTTAALLGVYFSRTLRTWAMTVRLSVLVLYHTVRFVGIAFLVLYARGVIPGEFAITAGWGDIAVAVAALLVVAAALPITSRGRWWVVLGWNVFGLLDILTVLAVGIRLGFADLEQMIWITEFPMSLLPTFIVPLVLVTHVIIFVRLRKRLPIAD